MENNKHTEIYLYLDDIRIPRISVPDTKWVIVRSYDEFVTWIKEHGIPQLISFDHDLADEHYDNTIYNNDYKEKTGYECAKWLVDYCIDNDLKLQKFTVHSANPSGAANILGLLNNFKKFCGQIPNGYQTTW